MFDFYGADPKDSPDYGRIINDQHTQPADGLLDGGTATVGGDRRPRRPIHCADGAPGGQTGRRRVLRTRSSGRSCRCCPWTSVDAAIDYVNEREKPLALYVFSGSRCDAARRCSSGRARAGRR